MKIASCFALHWADGKSHFCPKRHVCPYYLVMIDISSQYDKGYFLVLSLTISYLYRNIFDGLFNCICCSHQKKNIPFLKITVIKINKPLHSWGIVKMKIFHIFTIL